MPSEAHKRARDKWDAANMATLGVKLKKADADAVRARAEELGLTVNAYIRLLISKDIHIESK